MRMGDVSDAFPLLPLAPALWVFFLFWWFDVSGESREMWLYAHLNGDFGASGLPGTWKLFFTDVMVGVARSEGVLTLEMPVFVDDCSLIGEHAQHVDREGVDFRIWLKAHGVTMKELKERVAAQLQLALGFWWDSVQRTRTLQEQKLHAYLQMLDDFSQRRTLALREMQQVAGRVQRAAMTLPQGSVCFLAALFALMRGLSLPWQRRRTSRAVRSDFAAVAELLRMNMGRGFFSIDHMPRAPAVYTDASKESRYAGGGYFSTCGRYRSWYYGSSASKQCIDALEGDAVCMAAADLCHLWRGCVVPFYIDNRSFQLSAAKGWSRADRLMNQLKFLFKIAIEYECVYEFHWISTHENLKADALSRVEGEPAFLRMVLAAEETAGGSLMAGASLQRHAHSGLHRRFGKEFSSDVTGDGHLTSVCGTALGR